MPISRRNKSLATRRTQDYSRVLTGAPSEQTRSTIAATGANVLTIAPDLNATATVGAGSVVDFYVAVTAINSTAAVTYQWQTSTDGVTWVNVPNATTSAYSRAFALADNDLRIRVRVAQLLRTISSNVCRVTVIASTAPVSGLDGPAAVNMGTCYLSGLFSDSPTDTTSVSRTHVANLNVLSLFSDPWSGPGGASTKFAVGFLTTLFAQPNGVEDVRSAVVSALNLNTLFSDELDVSGIFNVVAGQRIFSIANTSFNQNIAGVAGSNYDYTASNLPLGLTLSAAGAISGTVISDVNFERNTTITAKHKVTSAVSSITVTFVHSQLMPSSTPRSTGLTVTPNLTPGVAGVTYSGTAAQLSATEFLLTPNSNNTNGVVTFSNSAIAIANMAGIRRTQAITFSFNWRAWDGSGADGLSFEFAPTYAGPILNRGSLPTYTSSGLRLVFDTYPNSGNDYGIWLYLDKQQAVQIYSPRPRTPSYTNLTVTINRLSGNIEYAVGSSVGSFVATGDVFSIVAYTWPVYFTGACGGANDRHSISNFSVTYS
ncbi:MAG: hypothetical protein EBU08_04065 [Micrococcales bacterium]|nr:hypothetical protein [Micrococcales bacterium]